MYSKDMLVGILLSCAKVQFKIIRTDELKIGYKPIIGLSIRGTAKFLNGVQRSLLHWGYILLIIIKSPHQDQNQYSILAE